MKTMALVNGDLSLAGDRYAMISGIARVQQHLSLNLREPYGSDRFHERWGSVLNDTVGQVITPEIESSVRSEIIRVINNYISMQQDQLRSRSMKGLSAVVTAEEIITDITSISVSQEQDQLIAKVGIKTASAKTFSILTSPGRDS